MSICNVVDTKQRTEDIVDDLDHEMTDESVSEQVLRCYVSLYLREHLHLTTRIHN